MKASKKISPPTLADVVEATPKAVLVARSIVADPVGRALKQMLKEIGTLIAERVSSGELHEIVERVCDRDPQKWSERVAPIDSAFNGIRPRGGGEWVS